MRAKFTDTDYLSAAMAIAVEHGPAAATAAGGLISYRPIFRDGFRRVAAWIGWDAGSSLLRNRPPNSPPGSLRDARDDGVGHWPQLEARELVNQALLSFLSGL